MEQIREGEYAVNALGRRLRLAQKGEQVTFFCTEEEFREIWEEYFDLGRDYGALREKIDPNDAYLVKAAEFGNGIRILHQDLWEMILTFLISQQNNIKRIKTCIAVLCGHYGKKKETLEGEIYDTFPEPEELRDVSEDTLRGMNFGYRSKYIEKTVQSVLNGTVDLCRIRSLPYQEAREELKRLPGVGDKVADCICLFGLGHLEAFPVDTHIKNVLQREYPQGFPFERYGRMAGIIQQYLFYYDLKGLHEAGMQRTKTAVDRS